MTQQTVEAAEALKHTVAHEFGAKASFYDQHAVIRKQTAKRLIASLEPWKGIIPPGPIIDLGCGTGFVTEGLSELFPDREIRGIDLSEKMVGFCREKFHQKKHLSFSVQDAEQPDTDQPEFGLTISNFLGHWFNDPALAFSKWLEVTKPGGLLLAAFPGNESFPEWRNYCKELGLPFTANSLPDVEEMVVKMSVGPTQVDYYEDAVTQQFDSARGFFTHLKQIGAATRKGGRSLTPKEFDLLINHWDSSAEGAISIRYHMVFLAVKRDFSS